MSINSSLRTKLSNLNIDSQWINFVELGKASVASEKTLAMTQLGDFMDRL